MAFTVTGRQHPPIFGDWKTFNGGVFAYWKGPCGIAHMPQFLFFAQETTKEIVCRRTFFLAPNGPLWWGPEKYAAFVKSLSLLHPPKKTEVWASASGRIYAKTNATLGDHDAIKTVTSNEHRRQKGGTHKLRDPLHNQNEPPLGDANI